MLLLCKHCVHRAYTAKSKSYRRNNGRKFRIRYLKFSNTEYLIKYPFKLVKLDKIFIWDAMKDDKAMKILEHTVAMIKSLDIQIVAEGVETKEQAGLLMGMGCDFLQGFLYSKPLQKELYIQFLKNDGNVNQ